ncbi:RNA-directed DNA polymerase, eukaryota, reverse transcriptase zinc-binding domain protein [Tanacetum coccineum]|uniref:RNA-directed DNA polymerase, eukaryota, reverse transcriptase zinc-binding domain protein n=1 Tax=Tanacetum coccineum TaxID=301880 RepID=A0ABQ5DXJ9_9ASTR
MLVEMADLTKKVPLGIVETILVKIDKILFSSDFVIIDMLKTRNETMILGRPFLATIHTEIDVFNKEISLGIRNDRIIFDMNKKSYKFTTLKEKAYMVNIVHSKYLMDTGCDLFLYESESCEFNRLLAIDPDIFSCDIDIQESYGEIVYTCCVIAQGEPGIEKTENETGMGPAQKRMHWCGAISRVNEGAREYWASCDPYENECNGGDLPDSDIKRYWESNNDNLTWDNLSLNGWIKIRYRKVCKVIRDRILKDHWKERFGEKDDDTDEGWEDPEKCGEEKNRRDTRHHHKLDDSWFSWTIQDEDDLDGITDYIKPTSYDGFVDSEDEAYKERYCELLGMPYKRPPLILIERVKVTRYNISPGETYTKTKNLGIDEIP